MCRGGREGRRAAAYLFNWDGSAAPDAVRATLQAFLLFVRVTPFPRLQNENKVSIWPGLRLTDGARSALVCALSANMYLEAREGVWVQTSARAPQKQAVDSFVSTGASSHGEFSKLFPCKIIF